jgi:hypothetical protein
MLVLSEFTDEKLSDSDWDGFVPLFLAALLLLARYRIVIMVVAIIAGRLLLVINE